MALVGERMKRVALAAAAAVESSFWAKFQASSLGRKSCSTLGRCSTPGTSDDRDFKTAGVATNPLSSVSEAEATWTGIVVKQGGKSEDGKNAGANLLSASNSHKSAARLCSLPVQVSAPPACHLFTGPSGKQTSSRMLANELVTERDLSSRTTFLGTAGLLQHCQGITSLPHLEGLAAPAIREERVGLYGYEGLMEPQGFRGLVREAIETTEGIIHDIRHAVPSVATVKGLDDISNTVCTVLDAAELCRNTHPDREWVEEADHAYLQLSRYVQALNTNTVLFDALVGAMEGGSLETEEAIRVASMLRMDFERGGIHLPEEKRAEVEHLNNRSTQLGMQFGANIMNDQSFVDIYPSTRLRNVPVSVQSMLQRVQRQEKGVFRTGSRVPTDPMTVQSILKWVEDPEVRRQVYLAGHSSPQANVRILDELIANRHEVAQLLGFDSYADFFLRPLMARTPDAVVTFLETLSAQLKEPAQKEFAILAAAKNKYEPNSPFRSWDRGYYVGLVKAQTHDLDARVVAEYFPLEHCLSGLNVLTTRLFGMALREVPLAQGEGWANGVRKFVLTHHDEGEMGVVYMDLFPRPNKYTHAAHFTLRCGRKESEEEWQLPAVALVCNLPPPTSGSPSLLSHGEVETMFHEFGHALHTLLSRTEFQHLSGTRGKLDFVETPSNLLELFVDDHRVLRQFAKHYSTGEIIPARVVDGLRQSKRMFSAMDLQTQVVYSLMDQAFFGPQSPSGVDTTAVLAQLQEEHTSIGHVEGTCWQARFNHLVGYGAGYYSYLYAKAFSSELWAQYFAWDPLNREAGEMLRRDILQYGGAKNPTTILRDVLGEHSVKETSSGGIVPSTQSMMNSFML